MTNSTNFTTVPAHLLPRLLVLLSLISGSLAQYRRPRRRRIGGGIIAGIVVAVIVVIVIPLMVCMMIKRRRRLAGLRPATVPGGPVPGKGLESGHGGGHVGGPSPYANGIGGQQHHTGFGSHNNNNTNASYNPPSNPPPNMTQGGDVTTPPPAYGQAPVGGQSFAAPLGAPPTAHTTNNDGFVGGFRS